MTWRAQVSSWRRGSTASRFPTSARPSPRTDTAAISQCPSTTVPSEATRSRSTYLSREAGVRLLGEGVSA